MKVNHLHEIILLSVIMFSLATGGIFMIKELSPDVYNQITGEATASSVVNITPAALVPCDFTLQDGLNLASFFCIGSFQDIVPIFQNFPNLVGLFAYEVGSSDPWKAYNPNLPSSVVNDLTFLTRRTGYWVLMNGSSTFFFNGTRPVSTDIAITSGYQLVGYPQNYSQNIGPGLQTINGSYSKVVGFDPVSKFFFIFLPNGTGSNLSTLDPYRGYWINGTATDTWIVT